MTNPRPQDAKRAARTVVRRSRRTRAALPPEDPRRRAEAEAIAAAVLARLPDVTGAVVASYVALPTEPPTATLNARLLRRAARVIVPVLLPDKDLDWAPLDDPRGAAPREEAADDGDAAGEEAAASGDPIPNAAPTGARPLGAGPTGARTLGVEAIAAATVIVVPALLVDSAGRRLGQGGGSYDRALARRRPDALVVALVDDDGLVASVPAEPHDARVTAVVRPGAGWTDLPTT